MIRKDGTAVPVEVTDSPIFDGEGNVMGIVGISHDITRRRGMEEQSRILIEGATDYAIFAVTNRGTVASWNPGAERIFGYTDKEIIGQSAEILFTPEDRSQARESPRKRY